MTNISSTSDCPEDENLKSKTSTKFAGVKAAAALTYVFGWLSAIGGPISGIALATHEVESEKYSSFFENYYTVSSKPFVGFGIGIAIYGIIFGSFFIAIGGYIHNKSE